MALVSVSVAPDPAALPPRVTSFLEQAQQRIDAYLEDPLRQPAFAFVPGDFPLIYRTLVTIRRERLAFGRYFCEWGSGFGVVAGLASMLGFHAHGIEIEYELAVKSRQLHRDFGLGVEVARGSFLPAGAEEFADGTGEFSWLALGGADGHEVIGLDPADFDLVYAYPWPGEEEVIRDLFDHVGSPGALLLTYRGREGIELLRRE
jgi:hypothetical protein